MILCLPVCLSASLSFRCLSVSGSPSPPLSLSLSLPFSPSLDSPFLLFLSPLHSLCLSHCHCLSVSVLLSGVATQPSRGDCQKLSTVIALACRPWKSRDTSLLRLMARVSFSLSIGQQLGFPGPPPLLPLSRHRATVGQCPTTVGQNLPLPWEPTDFDLTVG